ncbi:MAG: radical SAM protein [Candidatus Aenigmatarchaeota archaeon]
MRILDNTLAVCIKNLKIIRARIVERNNRVFLEKECGEKLLIERDANFYKEFILPFKEKVKGKNLEEIWEEIRKRKFSTALYITSRCNLRCKICYLNFAHSMKDMTIEEIKHFLKKNKSRFISLTGGEPTVRKDLPKIIKLLTKMGRKVLIITNGIKLANRNYVKKLKEAGLVGVYLSFDGFDDKIYKEFRGKNLLKLKLKALENLEKEGISTILVPVIRKGFNEDQIKKIIEYADKHTFVEEVRFLTEYPNKNFFISDGYKILAKELKVNPEYFLKVKKLLWSFRFLPFKLKNMLGIEHCVIPLKRGDLKPLSFFDFLKEGINIFLWRIFGKKIKSILKLCFCSIYTPVEWDLMRNFIFSESNEGFEKVENKFPIQAMVGSEL